MRRIGAVVLLVCAASALLLVVPERARAEESAIVLTLTQSSASGRVGDEVRWTAAVDLPGAGDDLLAGWQVDFRSDAGWTSGPVATDEEGLAQFTTTGAVAEVETVVAVLVTEGCEPVRSAPVSHEWWQPELTLEVPKKNTSLADGSSGDIAVVARLSRSGEPLTGVPLRLVEDFRDTGPNFNRRGAGSSSPTVLAQEPKTTDADGEASFTLRHDTEGVSLLRVTEVLASGSPFIPARADSSHLWEDDRSVLTIDLDVPRPARYDTPGRVTVRVVSTSTDENLRFLRVQFSFYSPFRNALEPVPLAVEDGVGTAATDLPERLVGAVGVVASVLVPGEGSEFIVKSSTAIIDRFVPRLVLQPGPTKAVRPVGRPQQVAIAASYDGRAVNGLDVEISARRSDPDPDPKRVTGETDRRGHARLSWTREQPTIDTITARIADEPDESDKTQVVWRELQSQPGGRDAIPLVVTLEPPETSGQVGTSSELTAGVAGVRHQDEGEGDGGGDGGAGEDGDLGRQPLDTQPASGVPVDVVGDLGFRRDGLVTDALGQVLAGYPHATSGSELVVALVRLVGCAESTSDPILVVTTPSPVTPSPVTPSPVTPSPVTPSPVTPGPETPGPGDEQSPDPETPDPETPDPETPTPETPTPETPTIAPPVSPTPEPPTPPPPPPGSGSVSTAVHPGGPLEITGSGCSPGETVTVRLGEVVVGTTTADPDGRFRLEAVVPDMPLGRYQVGSSCGTTSSEPVDVTRTETVSGRVGAAATAVGGVLAFFALAGASLLRRVGG